MKASLNRPICTTGKIGVGLRYGHYEQALAKRSHSIDFVELHAENFFAKGGPTAQLLEHIASVYPVSIHGTAMGLGSMVGIDDIYLDKFSALVRSVNPILVSDHACFTWGEYEGKVLHSGDLLPLRFDKKTMEKLVSNINRVQQTIGREILIENVVTYLSLNNAPLAEAEFLAEVAERSECGLLIDLNNILVNLQNMKDPEPESSARRWLDCLPHSKVKELHLAGSTKPSPGELIIDDHSQPVSDMCWELYEHAALRFPHAATLIEWDNELPVWDVLVEEAVKARRIALGSGIS